MITPEMISRINELGRKQKAGHLTQEESTEQGILRRLYIDTIKNQVKVHYDTYKKPSHAQSCSCGCHNKH